MPQDSNLPNITSWVGYVIGRKCPTQEEFDRMDAFYEKDGFRYRKHEWDPQRKQAVYREVKD